MSDFSELKRLAEHHRSLGHTYTVVTPDAVLALIAENEALRQFILGFAEYDSEIAYAYTTLSKEG